MHLAVVIAAIIDKACDFAQKWHVMTGEEWKEFRSGNGQLVCKTGQNIKIFVLKWMERDNNHRCWSKPKRILPEMLLYWICCHFFLIRLLITPKLHQSSNIIKKLLLNGWRENLIIKKKKKIENYQLTLINFALWVIFLKMYLAFISASLHLSM